MASSSLVRAMGRLVVTGTRGFLGRHLVAAATERGFEVVAAEGDLREVTVARGADAVVHLAATRGGGDPWTWLGDELAMAGNVLRAGGTVLIPGSAAQYGMAGPGPVAEDFPTVPVSAYGAVKCVLEAACLAAPLRGSARVIWARSFNMIGPGQGVDAPVAAWARQIAGGATTVRTGNLDVVRDFLDVRDVAEVYLDLVASDFAGVVNVGSGEGVALRSVFEVLSGGGVPAEPDPALARATDPPVVVADVTRLRSLIGRAPRRRSLAESVADVLAELRAPA